MKRLLPVLPVLLIVAFSLNACITVDRGGFGSFERLKNDTSHGYNVIDTREAKFNPKPPVDVIERFEVRNGECVSYGTTNDCARNTERSEIEEVVRNIHGEGTEQWFTWSIYFPNNYKTISPSDTILGQFAMYRHKPAFWFVENRGYAISNRINAGEGTSGILIKKDNLRGKWHDIKLHTFWSLDSEKGFMRIWVNNILKFDYNGPTITKSEIFFKYGIYRSNINRYKSAYEKEKVPTQIVYYSNVRRSNTEEGLTPSK